MSLASKDAVTALVLPLLNRVCFNTWSQRALRTILAFLFLIVGSLLANKLLIQLAAGRLVLHR